MRVRFTVVFRFKTNCQRIFGINLLDKTIGSGSRMEESAHETVFEEVESIFSLHISFSLDGDFKRDTSEENGLV